MGTKSIVRTLNEGAENPMPNVNRMFYNFKGLLYFCPRLIENQVMNTENA